MRWRCIGRYLNVPMTGLQMSKCPTRNLIRCEYGLQTIRINLGCKCWMRSPHHAFLYQNLDPIPIYQMMHSTYAKGLLRGIPFVGFINLLAPDLVDKCMVLLQALTFVNILLKRHTRNAFTFSNTIKKHRHEV